MKQNSALFIGGDLDGQQMTVAGSPAYIETPALRISPPCAVSPASPMPRYGSAITVARYARAMIPAPVLLYIHEGMTQSEAFGRILEAYAASKRKEIH